MRCRIAARKKIVVCVGGGYRFQSPGYRGIEFYSRPRLGRAEELFGLAPHVFNRVEVGTVGGQEAQCCSTALDQNNTAFVFVRGKVVGNDDIARAQSGAENLSEIFAENLLGGCAIDGHTSLGAIKANRRNQRHRTPATVRGVIHNSLPGAGTSAQAGHVGFCPGFVDKDKSCGIQPLLFGQPLLPAPLDIRPILFAGGQSFFYSGIPGERRLVVPP